MYMQSCRRLVLSALLASGVWPVAALAQDVPPPPSEAAAPVSAPDSQPPASLPPYRSVCGNDLGAPLGQPPAGTPTPMLAMEYCFAGGEPLLPSETYGYYVRTNTLLSAPSKGVWLPYNAAVEQSLREDFTRLMDQGFLDFLLIEVNDYVFPNGVVGKVASYRLEERERIKIIRYEGTKQIDRTKIEEQLQERNLVIGVDSFVDEAKIRRVSSLVVEMMRQKGFNATVTPKLEPTEAGVKGTASKTVNLTFNIDEGPRRKIKSIDFVGNVTFDDDKLKKHVKHNKPSGLLSALTGTGTVNTTAFEEDAERVEDFYHNHGYPNVRVSPPEIRVLEDTTDGKTQWIELRIPVSEGNKYNFGELDFDGNKRIPAQFLRALYDIRPGELYNRKKLMDGNRKAQEAYGSLGFMEFTPFPDIVRSDQGLDPEQVLNDLVPEALALPVSERPAAPARASDEPLPTVDVTVRITEGEQFLINRIAFSGNTTTRDHVIRRELGGLLEGAPFNTEALKFAVRRVNQLGYFKPLEGNESDVQVDKTPGRTNAVDVTVKLEEQNRNQLTFGAGISQYEGFFGQLAFQTSNFMGRGETLSVSVQGGERAKNYQLGFTEPYLFDRNITGGINLHSRELQYIGYYTQKSSGGSLIFGVPMSVFTRAFLNYSYESVSIGDFNEALIDPSCLASAQGCAILESPSQLSSTLTETQLQVLQNNPFVADSLLLGGSGKRTISKITPTLVHNTVDHPIFPTIGKKLTAAVDLAVLGGNTQYYKPRVEGIWFFRHTSRTSVGLRGQLEFISPLGNTTSLPVFERLFLGGEYSIRGFDIRSIGPTVEGSQVVLGGNKSLLFNAEYLVTIAGPVRLVMFYDAGQVRDFGQNFGWNEPLTELVFPQLPSLGGLFTDLVEPENAPRTTTRVIGQTSAFKTSTGVELRFFLPVLNVPFRLIYAFNPQRGGVLDNNLAPAKSSTFRFAVGTTF
jgi:outer membrane protein insertion porin family